MSETKRRAQQLIGEMLDDAATTLKLSLKNGVRLVRYQPDPTRDARFVFAAALELDEVSQDGSATSGEREVGEMSIDDLAKARERLRAAKQAERKQA